MRIEIDGEILAGGSGVGEDPFDININGVRDVEIKKTLRGKSVETFNRGNFQTSFSFSVGKKHSSREEAERYVLIHSSSLAKVTGKLIVDFENKEGESQCLNSASIKSVESKVNGRASFHKYNIIGGSWSEI